MAQLLLQPSLMQRPSLGQRWNSFREKRKQTSSNHQRTSSSKAKGAVDDRPRTRSVGRPKRRNSFVRVDRAQTTTSQNTGGLIITSTSTKTVSHRTSQNEVEAPRKPSSMSSLKLSKKSPKIKVKKSKSGAIVASSTTTTKKERRKSYDDEITPRKPSSMPNLIRSGSSRSLKKKKKSKSKSTVKTTTTKSCTIHPHMLYEKPKSFSSLQQQGSSPRGSKMKKSKSMRSMQALPLPTWPTEEQEFDESPPSLRKSLSRSKSLRALSGSLRNIFQDNTSDAASRHESPQRPSSFRKKSKSSSKKKTKEQKQQVPRRHHKIIIVC